MNKILRIGIILLFSSIIYCQSAKTIMHFNVSNSEIPSDLIFCIAVDSSNSKWIGTDQGLAKYNGVGWTIYNTSNGLFSNKVTAIAFDRNDNIWIVDSVLSKYDGISWTHYSEPDYSGVPYNSNNLAIDSSGTKWLVKSQNILVSFNDTIFTNHITLRGIRSIQCFEKEVWITEYDKVYKYSDQVLKDCSWDKNTNEKIVLNIDDLKIDSNGDKWILGNHYFSIGGDGWDYDLHLYHLKDVDDYREVSVSCDIKSSYGLQLALEGDTKWIGVLYYGLVKLAEENCLLYNHTNDSLLTNVIGSIAVDKQGNKWIAAPHDWYHLGISAFNENGVVLTSIKNSNNSHFDFSLSQNYPNPFNPSTTIKYSIPSVEGDLSRLNRSELKSALQNVTLKVYDILGREVTTLVNKEQSAGNYEVQFDASNLTSGIYFYKLQSGSFVESRKMILIK